MLPRQTLGFAALLACLLGAVAAAADGERGSTASAPDRLDLSRSHFAAPPPEVLPNEPADGELTLVFTGDTKLCGRTARQIACFGPAHPFALVRDTLRAADIAFGNCEGSLTREVVHTPGKSDAAIAAGHAFVFKSDPDLAGAVLADAGFDILQLANNHVMDYGAPGLQDTCTALDAVGVAYVGAGADYAEAAAPVVIEDRGIRVGYLAYSLIVPPGSQAGLDTAGLNTVSVNYAAELGRTIGELRPHCDVVVVGFHWGLEGHTVPEPLQRAIGHAAVEAGADLVIGTHPHSLQGIETYRGGLIAYSLGNFVFTGASRQLAGCILRVRVAAGAAGGPARLVEVALLPCWIRDGRPTPSADKHLLALLTRVMAATGSSLTAVGAGWLTVQSAHD